MGTKYHKPIGLITKIPTATKAKSKIFHPLNQNPQKSIYHFNTISIIYTDKVAKSTSGVLSDLVNYIKYNQDFGVSEEGTIKSIYDYLYEDYQEVLDEFRLRHPSKDVDSENLTKELLRRLVKL